jgi:hypothetical protein
MSNESNPLNFSQRNNFQPVPEQLKLQQVSADFRRLLNYALYKEIKRFERNGVHRNYFNGIWELVAQDLHVKFYSKPINTFNNESYEVGQTLEKFINSNKFDKLFNLIEFLAKHPACTNDLKKDLGQVFVEAQAAYRLKDNLVIAVGTSEQANALLKAIDDTDDPKTFGARGHLIAAGKKLADRDWVGSVRESIHSVEATALNLAPGGTLGPALAELESRGTLHGGLKKAFGALYGYTSDKETGVRHANVFGKVETVDETDALFMLGACASFVSYLIARNV